MVERERIHLTAYRYFTRRPAPAVRQVYHKSDRRGTDGLPCAEMSLTGGEAIKRPPTLSLSSKSTFPKKFPHQHSASLVLTTFPVHRILVHFTVLRTLGDLYFLLL